MTERCNKGPGLCKATRWRRNAQVTALCLLTYSRDKLVALSGVARSVDGPENNQYLAGMWRANVKNNYVGRQYLQMNRRAFPNLHLFRTAPSLGLGYSTDFPVNYSPHSEPVQVLSRILDAAVTPVGDDMLGEIQDAKLQLRCYPLLNVTYILQRRDLSPDPKSHPSFQHLSPYLPHTIWGDKSILCYVGVFWDWRVDPNKVGEKIYLLLIYTDDYSNKVAISGLLVTKSNKHGQFARVGVCKLYLEIEVDEFFRAILNPL